MTQQTMLAHADEAHQRPREDQTTLSGHLRLYATFVSGRLVRLLPQWKAKDLPEFFSKQAFTR